MENLNYGALLSKYFGAESPIKNKMVDHQNFFTEDCEDGYVSAELFISDLGEFSNDLNSRNGFKIFIDKLTEGKNFTPSEEKTDAVGQKYYWITYYQGRQTLGFKLPSLTWTNALLNTDRSVKFDLKLEDLILKASEILKTN